MKKIILHLLLFGVGQSLYAPILFQGLVEDSSIDKNSFLCPTSASDCKNEQLHAQGFDISGGRTLQLCNNQQYWLQQAAIQAQYISTVRNYTGSALTAQLNSAGWAVMGGFVVIISTNPILTKFIMPTVSVKKGQIKIVAQLWYNGSDLIQLWSQDAIALSDGQSFQVSLSNAADTQLSTELTAVAADTKSWHNTFLFQLGIQAQNRKDSDYSNAIGSPRQVKLTIANT